MTSRLFHFSDIDSIERFEPRPVRVPSQRPEGYEWLNGPLVWAIDEWHQPMYLFPRDCPRILLWRKDESTENDVHLYFGSSGARILAYVEESWLRKIESETLYRYELPAVSFQSLEDAGMWVSRNVVEPDSMVTVIDLPDRLHSENVELRVLEDLTPLKSVWNTSLHASGIRLRNAPQWQSATSTSGRSATNAPNYWVAATGKAAARGAEMNFGFRPTADVHYCPFWDILRVKSRTRARVTMTEADLLVEFSMRTDRIWDITQWWASVTFGVLLAAHVGVHSLNKLIVSIILLLFTLFTVWVAQIVWANLVALGAVKLALNDIASTLSPVGQLVLEDSGRNRGITMIVAVSLTYLAAVFYIQYQFRKV